MGFGVSHSTLADISGTDDKNRRRVLANLYEDRSDPSKSPEKLAETSLTVRRDSANHMLTETISKMHCRRHSVSEADLTSLLSAP
jgi:hypothetical protein